ncbi:MAG TPA: amidase family protein, partial [Isosphaeraceae bacterium]|nr:amidase family protein [Isosphaeraceae bacterium]
MDITRASVSTLLSEQSRGACSAEEIARLYLDRIERLDTNLNAFLHLDPERVVSHARSVDDKRRRGEPLGPLAGIPVAIKDVL